MWTVNSSTRAVTQWNRACDKILERLTTFVHDTADYQQYCHVERVSIQDAFLAENLQDLESTPDGILCILGADLVLMEAQETDRSLSQQC